MAQLVSARAFVIMPQENISLQSHTFERTIKEEPTLKPDCRNGGGGETHVQVLQTVPAEGVFAALAQHLGTALVPLDVDAAHGALLDGQVGGGVRAAPAEGAELTQPFRPGVFI